MGWADTVKATALTVLAERKVTTVRTSVDALWTWDAYDVWLSRVRPSREIAALQSQSDTAMQPRRDTTPRD